MAQLGGIVMLDPEAPAKEQFFFGGIEKCRFKKPVVPGDTLVRRAPLQWWNNGVSSSICCSTDAVMLSTTTRPTISHRWVV